MKVIRIGGRFGAQHSDGLGTPFRHVISLAQAG